MSMYRVTKNGATVRSGVELSSPKLGRLKPRSVCHIATSLDGVERAEVLSASGEKGELAPAKVVGGWVSLWVLRAADESPGEEAPPPSSEVFFFQGCAGPWVRGPVCEVGEYELRADFCGGNLWAARVGRDDALEARAANDCQGEPWESKHSAWFHFVVVRAAPGPATATLRCISPSRQSALYRHGYRPACRPVGGDWARLPAESFASREVAEDGLEVVMLSREDDALCYGDDDGLLVGPEKTAGDDDFYFAADTFRDDFDDDDDDDDAAAEDDDVYFSDLGEEDDDVDEAVDDEAGAPCVHDWTPPQIDDAVEIDVSAAVARLGRASAKSGRSKKKKKPTKRRTEARMEEAWSSARASGRQPREKSARASSSSRSKCTKRGTTKPRGAAASSKASSSSSKKKAKPALKKKDAARTVTELSWTWTFEGAGDACEFAFCYPYSYEALNRKLDSLVAPPGCLLKRETLTSSLEGRPIEMLTVTESRNLPDEEYRLEARDTKKMRYKVAGGGVGWTVGENDDDDLDVGDDSAGESDDDAAGRGSSVMAVTKLAGDAAPYAREPPTRSPFEITPDRPRRSAGTPASLSSAFAPTPTPPPPPPPGGFNNPGGSLKSTTTLRAVPEIVISARVHPGETPASFVMDGLVDLLLDPVAGRELRTRFVWRLVPMLNPDGVSRGHFRRDLGGDDLNRTYWPDPDGTRHPANAALVALVDSCADRLFAFVDCHAHATKRGCFIFGNYGHAPADRADTQLLAALLAARAPAFEFEGSDFSRRKMTSVPGSARVALRAYGLCDRPASAPPASFRWPDLFPPLQHDGPVENPDNSGQPRSRDRLPGWPETKGTDLRWAPRAYTLECNFNQGHVLDPAYLDEQPPNSLRAKLARDDYDLREPYTPAAWRGVGRGLGLALLDLARADDPNARTPALVRDAMSWLDNRLSLIPSGSTAHRRGSSSSSSARATKLRANKQPPPDLGGAGASAAALVLGDLHGHSRDDDPNDPPPPRDDDDDDDDTRVAFPRDRDNNDLLVF